MIVISTIPFIVMVLGILIYALTSHKTAGLVVMGCGLVVLMYVLSTHVVTIG